MLSFSSTQGNFSWNIVYHFSFVPMAELKCVSGAATNELLSVNIIYENFIVDQLVKQFSAFMEPDGS